MSFSFNVRARSKAEAISKVDDELGKVVTAQPVHAADRVKAQAAVEAYINLIADPSAGEELSVGVAGSVSTATARTVSAMVSVNVTLLSV